jgi:peptidoglycan/LPS O-acetylase OafA/YrhL
VSGAERTFRLLLRAYPARFRADYGREMALVFRDRRREPGARGARFWGEVLWDVARSAPALRVDAMRARWQGHTRSGEGTMRRMAVFTVLAGTFQLANTATNLWPGLVLPDPVTLVLATLAGALMAGAGVALLRRPPAVGWAQGLAAAGLAAFAVARFIEPWMSILAQLLGLVFPVVLLLYLRRRRGPGMPMAV